MSRTPTNVRNPFGFANGATEPAAPRTSFNPFGLATHDSSSPDYLPSSSSANKSGIGEPVLTSPMDMLLHQGRPVSTSQRNTSSPERSRSTVPVTSPTSYSTPAKEGFTATTTASRPSMTSEIRLLNRARGRIGVGIIGAGKQTRARHIPGLRNVAGVELVGVCNRSRQSSEAVAREYGIPKVFDSWRDLIRDPAIDAILIGTWPNVHHPIFVDALENGKHVLTMSPLAGTYEEAKEMLAISKKYPQLVTMMVPAPNTFRVDNVIRELIDSGFIGQPLVIEARITSGSGFIESEAVMTWQHDRSLCGINALSLGAWYEILMRWVGPAVKVSAMTRVFSKHRRDNFGSLSFVEVPDFVDVIAEMACGGQLHLVLSSITALSPHSEVILYGSEGTLQLDVDAMCLFGGRKGQRVVDPIPIPVAKEITWRVEAEFIGAIRNENKVRLTDITTAAKTMEFVAAVMTSAKSGSAVSLPMTH